MGLKKGNTNNPNGRPKGVPNKVTGQLRETITAFLEKNFEVILADFKKMQPKDRTKLYTDLLQYGLPKLQTTELDIDFSKMTDDQLDYIIGKLNQSANDQG
jgi:hypothetical protein